MQINCFVEECHMQFESADEYIGHLRDHHRVPSNYRFPCTYPKCLSVFSKLYPFKRHILSHRFQQASSHPSKSVIQEEATESEAGPSCISSLSDTQEKSDVKHRCQNLDQSLLDIKSAAVNFTLKLHKKSNLTRADVRSIQEASQDVYSIIAEKIEEIPVHIDAELQFKFEVFVNSLKSTFNFINTDYKFFKYLQQ